MPDTSDRLTKLQDLLHHQPHDTFLLYAVAMEYRKLGKLPEALCYLARVLERDPTYAVAYQQAAQIHEVAGNLNSAQEAYRAGIQIARTKGDLHAAVEMQAALTLIE